MKKNVSLRKTEIAIYLKSLTFTDICCPEYTRNNTLNTAISINQGCRINSSLRDKTEG